MSFIGFVALLPVSRFLPEISAKILHAWWYETRTLIPSSLVGGQFSL